ncbi:MAG: hypothetical protein ABI663_15640 [Chryseolinea sp.]
MERIYFDKQIFSFLFKDNDPVYQNFLVELYNNKQNFLYCYSRGHLLDLKNDKTEIKYKELEFIETLVGDNYISYNAVAKKTSCYLATPKEVFKDIEEEDDDPISFNNLFDDLDLDSATEEQREQITRAKEIFTNQKFDFGFSNLSELSDELKGPLGKMLPIGKSSMTLMEWTEYFMESLKSMEEDKSVYKGLRNVVDQHINNGKFVVDFDTIDFNDDLKNSVLKKSFTEYVNGNLNPNGNKEVTDYDFFLNAYFTLDVLGISKEPSKNVKFRNVINDSYHSYYGAFCDYVVSDDLGFLKKSRALYRLLDIRTKIFHVDEFIRSFNLLSKSIECDLDSFFKLLDNDLRNGIVINSKPSIKYNRHTTTIKPYHQYLGYFNRIDSMKEDNQDLVYLYRSTKNYSYFNFYREYEGVINKAIALFGSDFEFKSWYRWPEENDEIEKGTWKGRFWKFDNLTLQLDINEGTEKIGLLVIPKVIGGI